jgi:hypothetical protein
LVYQRRFQKGFRKMNKTEIDNILDPIRGQVRAISAMLPVGSKYYTVNAKEIDQQFAKKKAAIDADSSSPAMILNRSPRVVLVRDHSVIDQKFTTEVDGTKMVVFNPGTEDEANATVIAGDLNVFQTTDEAFRSALTGQRPIFANGIKTATKANVLNQAELDRLLDLKKTIDSYIDSLKSAIASNTKKVKDYEEAIAKFKQPVDMSGDGSVHVIVTE